MASPEQDFSENTDSGMGNPDTPAGNGQRIFHLVITVAVFLLMVYFFIKILWLE